MENERVVDSQQDNSSSSIDSERRCIVYSGLSAEFKCVRELCPFYGGANFVGGWNKFEKVSSSTGCSVRRHNKKNSYP